MPRPKKSVVTVEEEMGGAAAPPTTPTPVEGTGVYKLKHNVVFMGRIYSAGQELELSEQEKEILLPFLEV
jgi:hypothetical protein